MMTLMESRLVLILSVFYNFYVLVSLSAQALLLYLMIKCTVNSLKDMRIYLFNILVLQFISTVCAYLLQCRVVPSSETVAMLCYGPCKYLGAVPCEVIFHILEASLIACATALIVAFYHRYEMLTVNSFTRTRHYKHLIISYCVPVVFIVFEVLSPSDINKIAAEIKTLHPTYDLDNYVLLGFSEVRSVTATVQTLMIFMGVYGTPFIALFFRKKIMKVLKSTRSYHAEKIEQTKSMVLGLTIQTLFPLLCYCPSFTYYMYAQYTNTSSIIAEFATSPFGFLYTFFDPLLTIYFVLPYRRSFKILFSKNNSTATTATMFQSETHTSRRNDVLKL